MAVGLFSIYFLITRNCYEKHEKHCSDPRVYFFERNATDRDAILCAVTQAFSQMDITLEHIFTLLIKHFKENYYSVLIFKLRRQACFPYLLTKAEIPLLHN